MDHIDLPSEIRHSPIIVHYVCSEPYDNGPFFEYPSRQGWTEADIWRRSTWCFSGPRSEPEDTRIRSKEEVLSFLQNWLYFGLLKHVLGSEVQDADFVQRLDDSSTPPKISTARLTEHGVTAIARWRPMTVQARSEQRSRVDRALNYAHAIFGHICSVSDLDPAILFSIAVLADFLTYIRNAGLWDNDSSWKELIISWPSGANLHGLIGQRMTDRGWCLSQVTKAQGLSPTARYLVINSEPPISVNGHADCSRYRCLGYQLDWSTYQPAHVSDGCDCPFMTTEEEVLVNHLRNNQVPVISTESIISSKFSGSIPIVGKSSVRCYVAISHVWSDFMGNTRANAMRTCQIRRLVDSVLKLYGPDHPPVAFWIDTLCCPVKPMWARRKAIELMRETYADADKVLVFEKYLLSCKIEEDFLFKPFLRLYMSTWTARLWTLQEGMLAKSLFIQLADRAVDVEKEWRSVIKDPKSILHTYDIWSLPARIRGGFFGSSAPVNSVYNLAIAVHERFTSWATDEALCLGTLCGIDVAQVLEGPDDERMQRFWELLPQIPSHAIFWTGLRLTKPGFGWAPATLLNSRLELFHSSARHESRARENYARRTTEGLMVSFSGCLFSNTDSKTINRRFYLRDRRGRFRYWVCLWDRHETEGRYMLQLANDDSDEQYQLAIITDRTLGLSNDSRDDDFDHIAALLVKIISISESTIKVTVIEAANIYSASPTAIPPEYHVEAELQTSIETFLDGASPAVNRNIPLGVDLTDHPGVKYTLCVPQVKEELPEHQNWCIV